jgi:hypothetical protein
MAGNLRSPRKRALEIGTASGGFPTDIPYDPSQGVPQSETGGTYKCPVGDVSPKAGGAPAPSPYGNLR